MDDADATLPKRPCGAPPTPPIATDPLRLSSSSMDAFLESFLGLFLSSTTTTTDPSLDLSPSLERILESRVSSDQDRLIHGALTLGSLLLKAANHSQRKRFSDHNSLAWILPIDLTVKVFSMLDTESLCHAAAACSMFHKCAMDSLCYAEIDLRSLLPKVNNAIVNTMVQRAGKNLQFARRWRDSHHGSREFVRWGSDDLRRPSGHSKQGGYQLSSEESSRGFASSRAGKRSAEEESGFRPSALRGGDGKYYARGGRATKESFSQRDWRGGHGSEQGRQHDVIVRRRRFTRREDELEGWELVGDLSGRDREMKEFGIRFGADSRMTKKVSLKLGVLPYSDASAGPSCPIVYTFRNSTDARFSWNDRRSRQGKESYVLTRSCLASLSADGGSAGALLRKLYLYNIDRMDNAALSAALSACPSLLDLEIVGLHVELKQTLESLSANCHLLQRLFFESSKTGRDDSLKSQTCVDLVNGCPLVTSLSLRGFKLLDYKIRVLLKGFRKLKVADFSTSYSITGSFLRNLGSGTTGHLLELEVAHFLHAVLAGDLKFLRHLDISNKEGLASDSDWYDRCYSPRSIPMKRFAVERPEIQLLAEFPPEGSFIEIDHMLNSEVNSDGSSPSQISSPSSDVSFFMTSSESSYNSDQGEPWFSHTLHKMDNGYGNQVAPVSAQRYDLLFKGTATAMKHVLNMQKETFTVMLSISEVIVFLRAVPYICNVK
ncbi:hypothetical protein Scep_009490 [Stephania cephalantha]|uniref:F-box domain-containing protein n=1 Tax=Stephania cephalantha TaxID=152367 RepID=A0AAP0PED9_9MAGN